MPVKTAMAMFVIFLVGFLVAAYAIALIVKFIGGALKPTLPSPEAPVRKVVVRRRTVRVVTRPEDLQPVKPRPKVVETSVAGPVLTT